MNQKSRRNVLKGLAIGVPATWTKPVVDSAILPAHANTSGPGCVFWFTHSVTGQDWYVDFEGGNYLPADAPAWIDNPTCSGPMDEVSGCANVYVPEGTADPQEEANSLCDSEDAELFDESSNVYSCFCE